MRALFLVIFLAANANALQIRVHDRQNFKPADIEKLEKAVVLTNSVLSSPDLKELILNYSYQGRNEFVQNNNLSNAEIYDLIMSGAERYPKVTEANQVADLYLKLYFPPWWKRFTRAVAFTNQDSPTVHLYARYFRPGKIPEICGTLVHEWLHKVGFSHDFRATARRPHTVPYAIGSMVESLVQKIE